MNDDILTYYKTYNYNQFKFLDYNRTTGSNKSIEKSIDMIDVTKCCPIIVTPDYYIIDGQNRFNVCKKRNLPVYYIVYDGNPELAMIALNTATRVWKQEEWLHYYVSKSYPCYIKLKYLMDKHNIDISNAILIFSNGKSNATDFKKGKLKDESRLFESVVVFLRDIIVPKDVRYYRAFVSAVMGFINEHEKEPKVIKKLEKRITSIVKYSRIEDYRNAFNNLIRK